MCKGQIERWWEEMKRGHALAEEMKGSLQESVKRWMKEVIEREGKWREKERSEEEKKRRKEKVKWKTVEREMRRKVEELERKVEETEGRYRREKEDWKREEERLRERIKDLEREESGPKEEEEREKEETEGYGRNKEEERRRSIVIKEVTWRMVNVEREVEEFIEEKLKVRVKVRRAKEIVYWNGGQGMVAELESREEKREVMWKKKGLEKEIYIDDDLTKEERERKQRIRERMGEVRRKAGSRRTRRTREKTEMAVLLMWDACDSVLSFC